MGSDYHLARRPGTTCSALWRLRLMGDCIKIAGHHIFVSLVFDFTGAPERIIADRHARVHVSRQCDSSLSEPGKLN